MDTGIGYADKVLNGVDSAVRYSRTCIDKSVRLCADRVLERAESAITRADNVCRTCHFQFRLL